MDKKETTEPEETSIAVRSSSGVPSHLVIGRIAGVRGVKGELRVTVLTDFPERFLGLKRVFVGGDLKPYEVEKSRLFKGAALLKLRGVDSVDDALRLKGKFVHVPVEEAVPLPEGQYYWHEIIGLEVWTTTGELLGKVTEILRTGANDIYVVHDGKEILIPAIEQVVKEISPRKGRILVELMPGLV